MAEGVPGSVYERYSTEDVIAMMDEDIVDGSDDDLDLDLGSDNDER